MKSESFIAFEAMMKESPYSKFDIGEDGEVEWTRLSLDTEKESPGGGSFDLHLAF